MANSTTYPHRHFPYRIAFSLLALILPLFLCGGAASAYYFYDTVRNIVAYSNLPDYGSVVPNSSAQQAAPAMPTTAPPPNVAAGERINVLLMGIDKRPGENGPFRTDTMIVATLDPKTKTGGMLSVPRDLYVPIPFPNIGSDRINTANFYGDLYKYPGGGPALAKKTIEYNLGIPIHYYVLIDFSGFTKLVDALGGIDVDVAEPIDDPNYPTMDYGVQHVYIPAGHLHMNGDLALKYARSRHSTNDFDRSKRQMQIILACRDKALKLNMLSQVPQLWAQFQDTVHTDMTLDQILALAPIGAQLRSSSIKSRAIDQSMTYEIILNSGADVLWPERSKIATVVNEMFRAGNTAPAATSKPDSARIAVLNGTKQAGLADQAAKYLRGQGFNVVQVGNASRSDYKQTTVLTSSDMPGTVGNLMQVFALQTSNVQKMTSPSSTADIQVIIGADWKPPQ